MIGAASQITYGRIHLIHEKMQKENRDCYEEIKQNKNM